jgi:allophanate hydrolase subunit 2
VPGPRDDWFTAAALATLVDGTYRASTDSNRIALRLDGPVLERAVTHELPSEGLVLGAVQVPADGQPLVFLADHPTTGGYPVIAVVEDRDVDACAQVRPGDEVRFRWSTSSRPPPSGGDPGRYGAGA